MCIFKLLNFDNMYLQLLLPFLVFICKDLIFVCLLNKFLTLTGFTRTLSDIGFLIKSRDNQIHTGSA